MRQCWHILKLCISRVKQSMLLLFFIIPCQKTQYLLPNHYILLPIKICYRKKIDNGCKYLCYELRALLSIISRKLSKKMSPHRLRNYVSLLRNPTPAEHTYVQSMSFGTGVQIGKVNFVRRYVETSLQGLRGGRRSTCAVFSLEFNKFMLGDP